MGVPRLSYFLNQVRAASMLGLPILSLIFMYYGIHILRLNCHVEWIIGLLGNNDVFWLITVSVFLFYFINYRERNGYLELIEGMGFSDREYLLSVTFVTLLFSLPIIVPYMRLIYEWVPCTGIEGHPLFFTLAFLTERILYLVLLVGLFFRTRKSWLMALFPVIIYLEGLVSRLFYLKPHEYILLFPMGPLHLWTQTIYWNPYVWLAITISIGIMGVKLWP